MKSLICKLLCLVFALACTYVVLYAFLTGVPMDIGFKLRQISTTTFSQDHANTNNYVSKDSFIPKESANIPSECVVDESIDPSQSEFYNIIPEQEALKYKPCVDEKLAASPVKSKIQVLGDQKLYKLGEVVRILITLYDSNGKRKTTGGDHLRATLHSLNGNAHAPGVVTDNNDGSYTAELKTFWTGVSVINVSIAYTRELVTALYRVRTEYLTDKGISKHNIMSFGLVHGHLSNCEIVVEKTGVDCRQHDLCFNYGTPMSSEVLATRNIIGKFSSTTYSQDRLCHPNHKRLAEAFNQSELCNLTYINSGMPFYCLKPTNRSLLCQDWTHVKTDISYPVLSYSACEEILLKKTQPLIAQRITVKVDNSERRQTCPVLSTTPCSKYNRKRLWTTRQPSGYFKDDIWNLTFCKGIDTIGASSCLINKRLYLFGDSTLRQWYKYILRTFKCKSTTATWVSKKMHRDAECSNPAINFTAGWYPHSQPFFVGGDFDDVRYTLFSTSRRLDNIPSDENAIIVIQEFMHVLAYHYSVFEERMKLVKQSIERLLNRNKKAIVMLKAPHTFKRTPENDRLNDYFGLLYIKLLYNIFDGLHDRVILLNNADATNTLQKSLRHPPKNVVTAMVLQAISFACN